LPRAAAAAVATAGAAAPPPDAARPRAAASRRVASPAAGAPVLDAPFYARPVLEVAPALLGCVVVHGDCAGRIVETEAYHYSEPACHAHVGVTPRTHVLFGSPGTAYVYRSYGIHALLNAVCEPEGVGAAVLIRALEPLWGEGAMRARRGSGAGIANGPGKLTQALGVELTENNTSLIDGPIQILAGDPLPYVTGPRIGITKAAELPWRFCAVGSRDVSRPWPPGLNA
jgi:DNA-3-methyladenine glycosylase